MVLKKSVKKGISPLAEFANFHLLNILRKHIAFGDVPVKALKPHWLMAYQWKAIVHTFPLVPCVTKWLVKSRTSVVVAELLIPLLFISYSTVGDFSPGCIFRVCKTN